VFLSLWAYYLEAELLNVNTDVAVYHYTYFSCRFREARRFSILEFLMIWKSKTGVSTFVKVGSLRLLIFFLSFELPLNLAGGCNLDSWIELTLLSLSTVNLESNSSALSIL